MFKVVSGLRDKGYPKCSKIKFFLIDRNAVADIVALLKVALHHCCFFFQKKKFFDFLYTGCFGVKKDKVKKGFCITLNAFSTSNVDLLIF